MAHAWLDRLRLFDVVDILVVAALLYGALAWLGRTRYRRLAWRIVPVAGVVVVARAAQMHLTLFALQAVLAVGAVALIVVFQEEIRRLFERLAAPRGTTPAEPHGLVQHTVDAAFAMAKKGVGALIVLEGREPLSRLTSAGIGIEGEVSSVLLQSIFEPQSPGHDGAVILAAGRISSFAVHLPLAKSSARDVSGTRHAAALGIAERSDALAIVVSEEHGDVSLARAGRLARVESPAELAEHLSRFLSPRSEPAPAPAKLAKVLQAAGLSVLALVTSSVLWTLFASPAETLQRTYDVAIEYRNGAEDVLLDPPSPSTATVTLSGPARTIESIDPGSLALGIDASAMTSGRQTVRLSTDSIRLPREVEVVALDPEQVEVVATDLVEVTLPVRLKTTGGGSDLESSAWVVEPAELSIWLPRSLLGSIDHLETESLDVSKLNGTEPATVSVHLPEGCRPTEGDAVVRVVRRGPAP